MATKTKYIGDLFISTRWYLLLGACVIALFLSFFVRVMYPPMAALTGAVLLLTLLDYVLLFFTSGGVTAKRNTSPRFSIGMKT